MIDPRFKSKKAKTEESWQTQDRIVRSCLPYASPGVRPFIQTPGQ